MSLYDDLKKKVTVGEVKRAEYHKACLKVAHDVHANLQAQLGWPEDHFRRLPLERVSGIPDDAVRLPGGWFGNDGRFSFYIQVSIGSGGLNFPFRIYYENAQWHLVYLNKEPFTFDPANKDTLQPAVQLVTAELSKFVDEQYLKKCWLSDE